MPDEVKSERRRGGTSDPSTEAAGLATFERDYSVENFTLRDLTLDLAAALWLVMVVISLTAGRFVDQQLSTLQNVFAVVFATISAIFAVLNLTLIRRLDDQRTRQLATAMTCLAQAGLFVFSFYGPGALGAMYSLQVALVSFSAQTLGFRGLTAMLAYYVGFDAFAVAYHYGDPGLPHLLSQTVLFVPVIIAVGYSIFVLKGDRAAALEEAERAAFSDPLTGLPNTRMLRRRTEALLNTRNERIHRRTGLIVLDIDGFRTANMLRGHRVGDALLRTVADAMRELAADDMLLARTGSDEFSLLVPDADEQLLERLAGEYRDHVLEAIDNQPVASTMIDASVGYALSGEDVSTFTDLMRAADHIMYLQKSARERSPHVRRRPEEEVGWESFSREPAPAPQPVAGESFAFGRSLAWSKRPAQTRFLVVAWELSAAGVALSMMMPDRIVDWSPAIVGLIVLAVLTGIIRYVTEPATKTWQHFAEMLYASIALATTIAVTGGGASPATPILLLILIYIGWFMELRWVVWTALLSSIIVLIPTAFASPHPTNIYDKVTTFAGLGVSAALLVILYYNHYYIERGRQLTARLANLDPRALIWNRRAFEDRMREELDRLSYGDRDALAVVIIDLGNFKSVAANYGRAIGDSLLRQVAAALTAASREGDCVARLGGDEFAIVAPGVDAESARDLAERLVAAVHDEIEQSDLPSNSQVRPSAGFALYGMHGRTTDELVTAADVALTAAKTSGRDPNRVSSFVVAL